MKNPTGCPRRRLAFLLPLGLLVAGAAGATTWTVNVGQGGSHFVDAVTGTSTSRIVVGDAVHWSWVGSNHSTTSGSSCTADGGWDSGVHNSGFTFNHTFSSAGTFPYFCTIHCLSGMTGTVIVSPPPTLTNVNPNNGPSAGGTSVTLTGTNFQPGVPGTVVNFGTTPATSVVIVNSTTITCMTPVHAPGTVDVTVINPDLGSSTLAGGYTYTPSPAPLVTSVTPPSGPTAGGTAVTIGGNNFQSGPGLLVTIGGNPATGVSWVNAMTIDATTPAGVAGAADVVVTNPDTQSGMLAGGYTYIPPPPPSVTSVTPPSGPTTGGTSVTISGADFQSGATVTFGPNSATNVAFVDAATLTATTPAGAAGAVNVTVTNPDLQTGTLTNGYTYVIPPPPAVASITPDSSPSGGGGAVTIAGTDFVTGAAVSICGVAATGVNVASATQITATTGAATPGLVGDVVVTNPDLQTGTLPSAFVYDYLDVPPSSGVHDFVIKIAKHGITGGCGGGNFCPSNSVLRSQMAVFLLEGEHGSGYTPPACTGIFADVACPGPFTDFIEQLYAEGITGGCGTNPLTYCPGNAVSRAGMAVFLLVAQHGTGYTPPACTGIFADVACPSPFADWVEQLYTEGVTGGCGTNPLIYCPGSSVTRGQMAVFLTVTFSLQ